MVKNEAVTEATLEAKEWEGELDDADLIAVSGGGYFTDYFKALGESYADAGKSLGDRYAALGNAIAEEAKKAFG